MMRLYFCKGKVLQLEDLKEEEKRSLLETRANLTEIQLSHCKFP